MIIGISGKKQSDKDTVCKIIQYLTYAQICINNERKPFHTIQEFLEDKANALSQWKRKLFADKLKDIVCLLIGCTREQLEDNEFKETPLGEEWDIWRAKIADRHGGPKTVFLQGEEQAKNLSDELMKGYGIYDTVYKKSLTPRLLLQLIGTECGRNIIHPNIWVNALMSEYSLSHGFHYKEHITGQNYPNWIITDTRFPNELTAITKRDGLSIRINRIMPDDTKEDTHESETALDNYTDWDAVIDNDGSIEDLICKVEAILKQFKIL